MTTATQHRTDIREYLQVLRARKWEVATAAFVVVAAAVLFSARQTPTYRGEARVLVRPVQTFGSAVSVQQPPNLDTERQLVISQAIAQNVQSLLSRPIALDTLLRNVSVDVIADTDVLAIGYQSPSAVTAASVANAFANAYVDFRTQQALDQFQIAAGAVQKRIDQLQGQIGDLNGKIDATTDEKQKISLGAQRDTMVAQMGVLQSRLLDLQSTESTVQSAGQVIQHAEVPTTPVSPQKVRDAALGLFAGLMLGVGIAFARERFDDRVKSREQLEEWMGAPVAAVIPKVTGWRRREEPVLVMRTDPKSPVSEAYRTLATNLQYLASREAMQVILVTSSLGGEGKTTSSANLAVALAQSGKRVVLVSADLRKPRLHRFFGLSNQIGLSSLLADPMLDLSSITADPGIPTLRVLSAGPTPKNPAELLASERCRDVIQALRQVSDFVIVDTPPVLAVADASILSGLADGALFLVDGERSKRSAMLQSRAQLETAGGRIIGVLYNNFDPSQRSAYPYYYYSYHYQARDNGNGQGSNPRKNGRLTVLRGRKSTPEYSFEDAVAPARDAGVR